MDRAGLTLARRAFADARIRTAAFAYLFAIYAYIQPVGFRTAYPTPAARLGFAVSFAGNDAIRIFYGYPYDAATVAGYCAWRVGGTLAIAAAVLGVLAAVRALRAEEEAGRLELVLAGPVARRTALGAALAAIAGGLLIVWAAEALGSLAGGLGLGGSAYLALATSTVAAAFAGIGALAAQLAPTRRGALQLGIGAAAAALLVRAVADTAAGAAWMRWLTPLGWAEEMRPFTGARPLALLAPAALTALTLGAALAIAARRDIGTGILPTRERARPRLRLLGSPAAQALRLELGSLTAWTAGVALFAVVLGVVASSISAAGISNAVRKEVARLGSGAITSPTGYLAFVFIFFIVTISLFAGTQIAAARQEEAGEQLETLLALPVGRRRWLGGRLALAAGAAALLAAVAGFAAWAGASAAGVQISLAQGLEAGANCLPSTLMFLGIGALAYAVVPRASAAVVYGLVTVTFLWYLVGALLAAPHWLVELTPFAHIGFVPSESFRTGAALVMVSIGVICAACGLALFRTRDLTPA